MFRYYLHANEYIWAPFAQVVHSKTYNKCICGLLYLVLGLQVNLLNFSIL